MLIGLYLKQLKAPLSPNTRTWITHDGPPYANGNLHMGHFENKVVVFFHHLMLQVLKDIINRHKLLLGYTQFMGMMI